MSIRPLWPKRKKRRRKQKKKKRDEQNAVERDEWISFKVALRQLTVSTSILLVVVRIVDISSDGAAYNVVLSKAAGQLLSCVIAQFLLLEFTIIFFIWRTSSDRTCARDGREIVSRLQLKTLEFYTFRFNPFDRIYVAELDVPESSSVGCRKFRDFFSRALYLM